MWSCAPTHTGDYSARYLFVFLANHGMLTVKGSPTWRTVVGGSARYVEKLAKGLTAVQTPTTAEQRVLGAIGHVFDVGLRHIPTEVGDHERAERVVAVPESGLIAADEAMADPVEGSVHLVLFARGSRSGSIRRGRPLERGARRHPGRYRTRRILLPRLQPSQPRVARWSRSGFRAA